MYFERLSPHSSESAQARSRIDLLLKVAARILRACPARRFPTPNRPTTRTPQMPEALRNSPPTRG